MPTPDDSKIKEKIRRLPNRPGVYMMQDRLGRIIYVGKAKSLKKRVSTYFQPSRRFLREQPKVAAMVDMIEDFDTLEVRSEAEALLLEGKLIKQWKPRYNTDFTDDKRFLLVRVNIQDALPRFRLTRFRNDHQSLYYGPFAHAGLLRRTLREMRKKFGILLGDTSPMPLGKGMWQLYSDVRGEIYRENNVVTCEEYRRRVDVACQFLQGKSREWLVELRSEMMSAAESQEFEKAADLRDIATALETTIRRTRKFQRHANLLRPMDPTSALADLQHILTLPGLPLRIECFDISHVSGTFVVASLVHFNRGQPAKGNYRRFKINSFVGNDDFRAMEEVVARRYHRLRREDRPFPHLIVVDGGPGQVGAALRAFLSNRIEPPPLIGLAKKRETIIFPDSRSPLNLPLDSEALRLLQRIRDEAHRFANTYNAELRSRRIRESILNDFKGLGPARRKSLFEQFKSIERIRAATTGELTRVAGIGPKTAAALHAFLQNS